MKKVLILIAHGFEPSDLDAAKTGLIDKHVIVDVAAEKAESVRSWRHKEYSPGDNATATIAISDAKASDYDAVVLPGGQLGADNLRTHTHAVHLVRQFYDERKVVAAVGYAAWLLIEANIVKGHEVTSCPSLKTDLINAGAEWLDKPLVEDEGLITFRKSGEWKDFSKVVCQEIEKAQIRQNEFKMEFSAVLEPAN
jgi:protease I